MDSAADFINLAQKQLGPGYAVTGDEALIEAGEDEDRGGRDDDVRRAADIQSALADSEVAVIIAIRGGAWFTRILPRIDFTVLDGRSRRVAVFGFSELTTLVNLIGAHEHGAGVYDMGPAFLVYGLKRYAAARNESSMTTCSPEEWMKEQLRPQLIAWLDDIRSMIEGRGTGRTVTVNLIAGELPEQFSATFVGGNLTVLTTLVGTPYQSCVTPRDSWLLIEDLNEKPERLDRFLAHLTLAGFWTHCRGILLGDFHLDDRKLTSAVAALLAYHLPADRRVPVLATDRIGHVFPMAPLPLHTTISFEQIETCAYAVRWPARALEIR